LPTRYPQANAMPSFSYVAREAASGREIRNVIEANTEQDAIANLLGRNLLVVAIRVAMADIEKGDGISAALGRHPVFPVMIIRMLSAGEQTGKIDAMLERVADFLDDEIETILSGLTSLIEPLLIVFLGVTVGGIVIAMFLPIFKMSEIISPSR
ncbi:MAG: type II secretion system F family protein, partial [Pedosphaera sp.]|nr:type II secretion system F family protein [Pedosphaera sp.]